jgi:signal transduction histidine kinase
VRLPFRPTVRARLALLLAALLVLTAVVLLAAGWLLVVIRFHTTVYGLGKPGAQITGVSVQGPSLPGLLVQYGILLAALVAIAVGLAWLVAGRMLRPLRQITDTARRITGEDLHERLALGGPADELTELGDTFDAMLARLEAAFTGQQLFAANAAHELRTPLAVMRAELDLLLTGTPPSPAEVLQTATRLRRTVLSSERMLERLLTLTQGMLAPGEREPVPLDQITGQALAAAAETARAQGLTIRPGLHEARACGDPSLLGELAGNLIGNAVKYNCPDGWIAAGTRTDGDRAILEVSNSGQQLADADLDGLLEPFRRAGQQRTRNGSGLGLSIVRAIVTAHGGELGLQALAGGGLAVRVSLPAAPADGDGQDTKTPHGAGHNDDKAPAGQELSTG